MDSCACVCMGGGGEGGSQWQFAFFLVKSTQDWTFVFVFRAVLCLVFPWSGSFRGTDTFTCTYTQVNIDPTELLIQQLKDENERLKSQFGGGAPAAVPAGGGGMSEEEKQEMKKQLEEEMQAKMEENEKMMAEMSKSWEDKLKEAQEKAATENAGSSNEAARREKEAHILNVNEDPVMSGAICYFLPLNQKVNFGNRNSPGQEEILLGGVSIRPDHCRITNKDGVLDFGIREECKVLVNGQDVTGQHGLVLHHNDRLVIGTNYYFVVVDPAEREASPPEGGWPEQGWDAMQREIAKAQGLNVDVNWSAMTEEEKRRALLNDELVQVMPRVTEANALGKELKRDFLFETKVTSVMHKTEGMTSLVMVKVINTATQMEWLWEKDKFVNRVYLMRELYEKYLEGSLDPAVFGSERDPFSDPNEPMHVGYSSVFLKSLSFCITSEDDYAIYHDSQQAGIMRVKIEPCKPDGSIIREDDEAGGPYDDVEDPKDLLGKRLDMLVTVLYCRGLTGKFSSEVYVEFDFPKAPNPNRDDSRWESNKQAGTINPNFNFSQQITYPNVDDQVLHRLEHESAFFHVFGLQEEKSGGLQKKKMLSMAEVDTLQQDLRKAHEDQERSMTVLGKVQEMSVAAARNNDASESFVLELANTLADLSLDVQAMVDAAQIAGQHKSAAAAEVVSGGSAAEVGELQKKVEEEQQKVQALTVLLAACETALAAAPASTSAVAEAPPQTPRDEKDAAIKMLEEKLLHLEAVSKSMASAAEITEAAASGDAAGFAKQLSDATALLEAKDKIIHDSHEAERAAKSKLHEQNDELQSLRDAGGATTAATPLDSAKVATLENDLAAMQTEKTQLKQESTRLKGELDLAKAEAAKAGGGSKGCALQ